MNCLFLLPAALLLCAVSGPALAVSQAAQGADAAHSEQSSPHEQENAERAQPPVILDSIPPEGIVVPAEGLTLERVDGLPPPVYASDGADDGKTDESKDGEE
ncbi:MAG: hypothetical protein EOM20_21085 [Spartobacteria bacterium]|nr:hypothetical protein [Spartobacteria bacterium]